MFRAIPVSNRILSKKWDEKNHEIHMKKLNDMKSTIDAKRPASFAHLKRRAKKEQMLEDRYTEIERENRILLEKMSQIMQNKNIKARITKPIQKKSLNNESRKRQLIQITMENQALLKRLQDKQSSYNVVRWEEDRKMTEKRLKNMCEFPYRLGVTQEGRRNPSVDLKMTGRIATSASGRQTSSLKKAVPRKLEPLVRDTSRPVVFKRGMNLGDKYFLVEISLGHRVVFIDAHDVENPETFTLKMPIEEAVEIMGGEDKYEILASSLALEDGGIVLMDQRLPGSYEPKQVKTPSRKGLEENPGHSYHQSEPDIMHQVVSETESIPDQKYGNRSYDNIQQEDEPHVINFESGDEELQGEQDMHPYAKTDSFRGDYQNASRMSKSLEVQQEIDRRNSESERSNQENSDREDSGDPEVSVKKESSYEEQETEKDSSKRSLADMKANQREFSKEIENISEDSREGLSRTPSKSMKNQSSDSKLSEQDESLHDLKSSNISRNSGTIEPSMSKTSVKSKASVSSKASVASKPSVAKAVDLSLSKASVSQSGLDHSISKASSIRSKRSSHSEQYEEDKIDSIPQTPSQQSIQSHHDKSYADEKNTSKQSLISEKMSHKPSAQSFNSLAKQDSKLHSSRGEISQYSDYKAEDISHISESHASVSSKNSSHINLQRDLELNSSQVSNRSLKLNASSKDASVEDLNASKRSSATKIAVGSRRDSRTSQASKKSSLQDLSDKDYSQDVLDKSVSHSKPSLNNSKSRASSSEREVSDHEAQEISKQSIQYQAEHEQDPTSEKESESESQANISKASYNKFSIEEPSDISASHYSDQSDHEEATEAKLSEKKSIERLKTMIDEDKPAEVETPSSAHSESPVKKPKRKTGLNVVAEANEDANESLGDMERASEFQNLTGIKVSNIGQLDEAIEESESDQGESSVNTSFLTESTEKSSEFPKTQGRTRLKQFDTIMSSKKPSVRMLTESDHEEEKLEESND
jgi:E3 ubiquitin-protein ligase TRIP12